VTWGTVRQCRRHGSVSQAAGVNVDVGGIIIFGHRRDWDRDADRLDAPTVHVRALGFVATIDVWRVPLDMHGSGYRDIFRELKGRGPQLPG